MLGHGEVQQRQAAHIQVLSRGQFKRDVARVSIGNKWGSIDKNENYVLEAFKIIVFTNCWRPVRESNPCRRRERAVS